MVQTEINSRSYILAWNRSSIKSDIYTLFLNRIANTVEDPLNRKVWIFETYNDYCRKMDNYPVIVISSPNIPTVPHTFNKKRVDGRVEMYIYSRTKQELDNISSQVIESVLDARTYFRPLGITNLELEDDDDDFEKINEQVGRHSCMLVFSFRLFYKVSW